ncbi:MAG: PilZ domain-containing protein, partial [Myxococcales bacterium]
MTDETGMAPRILLVDDGDLDDIRITLRELGFAVARFEEGQSGSASVLISSARYALSSTPIGARRPGFHIVVTERMSSGLRRELDRVRPDFILEQPVDPIVLRLLVEHALYSGPERRRAARVPLRASVRYRVGLVFRSATLIEISETGCRLEAKGSFERGQRLTLVLRPELTGAGELALEARVAGAASDTARRSKRGESSLAFLPQDAATRSRLRNLVASAAVE